MTSGVGKDNPRKALPSAKDPNFLNRVAETVQTYLGYRGNILDRGVIMRDLVDAGLVSLRPGVGTGGGGSGPVIGGPGPVIDDPTPDLTPPPIPTGFAASTSKTMIQAVCDPQLYTQGHGHAKSIVYGATYVDGDPLPVFSDAVKLTDFAGDVFAFPVDPGAVYRLWLTWVSVDGVEGLPAGGTNGIVAEAGLLDSANIAFLTASKIRAGSISVGDWIQSSNYVANFSGWRINGNGTAEFQNVIVRGTIYANFGQIGGNTIDADGVESPIYIPGTLGWRLDSSGLIRAFAYSGTRVIDMAATGTSPTLKFSGLEILGNGTATFSGALSAATGTFAGALSAATGTFSGALSAASGTFSGSLTASAINAVDTINLAGQAVTIPAGAYTTGSVTSDWSALTTLQSVSLTSSGAPIQLFFNCLAGYLVEAATDSSTGGGDSVVLSLYRTKGGTETLLLSFFLAASFQGNLIKDMPSLVTLAFMETPGVGAVTYSVKVGHTATTSFGNSSVYQNRSLFLIEVKR